uniref:hypothetical protein n=1 Tax=Haliscomenobacter sp. TaxID=2717303 RepID=UPI003364DE15
ICLALKKLCVVLGIQHRRRADNGTGLETRTSGSAMFYVDFERLGLAGTCTSGSAMFSLILKDLD